MSKAGFTNSLEKMLHEIRRVLLKTEEREVSLLIEELAKASKIVVVGAGRVGMAGRGFSMRLAHLGLKAFSLGDSNVTSIGKKDLLLVCSGSGETQTIFDLAGIAKKNGARIALVTSNMHSRIAQLSNLVIQIKAPSKTRGIAEFISIQPMTTLNEQCLQIFFDTVVLLLMRKLGETHDSMWKRHSNLE